MNKIKRNPSSIFDEQISKTIKSSIESCLVEMWKLVYSDNKLDTLENNQKDKNRSSTKTDELHKKFAEIFRDCFGNFKDVFNSNFSFTVETSNCNDIEKQTKKIKTEQKDLYGKYFNVDMELKNIITKETHSTILLKAPMTSIFKNRFNLIDNMLGESLRVLTKENLKSEKNSLLFVTFMPKETFTLNKKHNNIKMEYSNHISLYSSVDGENTILDESAINDYAKSKIKEIVILYDFNFKDMTFSAMEDIKAEISRNSNFISVDDITIQYLRHYLYDFLTKNDNIPSFKDLIQYVDSNNLNVKKPIMIIDDPATKPDRRPRKQKP